MAVLSQSEPSSNLLAFGDTICDIRRGQHLPHRSRSFVSHASLEIVALLWTMFRQRKNFWAFFGH